MSSAQTRKLKHAMVVGVVYDGDDRGVRIHQPDETLRLCQQKEDRRLTENDLQRQQMDDPAALLANGWSFHKVLEMKDL